MIDGNWLIKSLNLINKQKQAIENLSQTLTALNHLIIQHVPELYLLLSIFVKVHKGKFYSLLI